MDDPATPHGAEEPVESALLAEKPVLIGERLEAPAPAPVPAEAPAPVPAEAPAPAPAEAPAPVPAEAPVHPTAPAPEGPTAPAPASGPPGTPLLPPPPPLPMTPEGHLIPPVTADVLALPLRTGDLVRQALDLLTRSDAGLRAASLYLGLLFLGTITPVMVISWLSVLAEFGGAYDQTWTAWAAPAGLVAAIGWLEAAVYARGLATVVIGGRAEGRPLRMPESLAIVRRRFWRLLGAGVLVGAVGGAAGFAVSATLLLALGPVEMLDTGLSLVVSLVMTTPFVYVPAAILLGEVDVIEAIRRSWRLVRLRPLLAVVASSFGVFSQFLVLFGISSGADVVARIVDGSGLTDAFPALLVLPVSAALVFAFGTLLLLVEAVSASAAVHAFEALTHFTGGLELGRAFPAPGGPIWRPWLDRGLLLLMGLGWLVLVGALANYPW